MDYCTGWFETYLGVEIADCCKGHDETLSTTRFYKCLQSKLGWYHAWYITLGGFVGAWAKYPMVMWKRFRRIESS